MGKKVFEVAKDLGIDHRELLKKCDALDIKVRNYMSVLRDADEDRLRFAITGVRPPQRGPGVASRRPEPARPGASSKPLPGPPRRIAPLTRTDYEEPLPPTPGGSYNQSVSPPLASPRDLIQQELVAEQPVSAVPHTLETVPRRLRAPRVEPHLALHHALTLRGLTYSRNHIHRYLAATRAARRVGALVLLAGTTGTGKSAIARTSSLLIKGASCGEVAVRPEWLQASDLLGYVDPLRGLFSSSEFVAKIREAARRFDDTDASDAVPPYVLLLDEMNLARIESYGADLLSVLEQVDQRDARVLQLYPSIQTKLWLEEYHSLSNDCEGEALDRYRDLKAFFDEAESEEMAHLLSLPPNLVIVGTLNTDQHTASISPKVIDRSFVLQSLPLTAASVFDVTTVDPNAEIQMVELPSEPEDVGPAVWARYPIVRQQLEHLLDIWNSFDMPPSRRMVRNARAYLAYTDGGDDAGEGGPNPRTADLLHLLLIPRIVLPPARAKLLAEQLDAWLDSRLAENDPVRQEVRALGERAESGTYGDVRGLR